MKLSFWIRYGLFFMLLVSGGAALCQQPENWTPGQLTEPAVLAAQLQANGRLPLIFSVGPSAIIPHSIDIGMVKNPANLDKFKSALEKLPRSADILIYCGCCPFGRCPDVRPAIALLQSLRFTNYHLLDLPTSIKADWIGKGYPVTP